MARDFHDYEGMREAAKKVAIEASNLQTLIGSVSQIVANLSDSWSDVAQSKFESQWNEMLPKFREFVPELEMYSQAVTKHADKMERAGMSIG